MKETITLSVGSGTVCITTILFVLSCWGTKHLYLPGGRFFLRQNDKTTHYAEFAKVNFSSQKNLWNWVSLKNDILNSTVMLTKEASIPLWSQILPS